MAWWLGPVVDHFSRRVMGFVVFSKEPNSQDMRAFLGKAISQSGATPKYLISDKGGQFTGTRHEDWCDRKGIIPRYCTTGRKNATAVIERFFRTLKSEWLRCIRVPLRRDEMDEKESELVRHLVFGASPAPRIGRTNSP